MKMLEEKSDFCLLVVHTTSRQGKNAPNPEEANWEAALFGQHSFQLSTRGPATYQADMGITRRESLVLDYTMNTQLIDLLAGVLQ